MHYEQESLHPNWKIRTYPSSSSKEEKPNVTGEPTKNFDCKPNKREFTPV